MKGCLSLQKSSLAIGCSKWLPWHYRVVAKVFWVVFSVYSMLPQMQKDPTPCASMKQFFDIRKPRMTDIDTQESRIESSAFLAKSILWCWSCGLCKCFLEESAPHQPTEALTWSTSSSPDGWTKYSNTTTWTQEERKRMLALSLALEWWSSSVNFDERSLHWPCTTAEGWSSRKWTV